MFPPLAARPNIFRAYLLVHVLFVEKAITSRALRNMCTVHSGCYNASRCLVSSIPLGAGFAPALGVFSVHVLFPSRRVFAIADVSLNRFHGEKASTTDSEAFNLINLDELIELTDTDANAFGSGLNTERNQRY